MTAFFEQQIIYHDNHIVIANKPHGMLSQRDKTGDDSILEYVKRFVKEKYNKPGEVFLGSVHRLDRPAGGLMVFAKTTKALTRLNEHFRKGEIKKRYLALVEGRPADSLKVLVHYLEKDRVRNKVRCFTEAGENRKMASLAYEVLLSRNGFSLLRIDLHTGRPHQIRAQLAYIGCPVVGDLKYGAKKASGNNDICLLSYSMTFVHPVQKIPLNFNLEYPSEEPFWELFADQATSI